MSHAGWRTLASTTDHAFQTLFYRGMSDVGRIVIGMEREEAEESTVAVGHGAHAPRDSKTVNLLVPRSAAGQDGFPSQPWIAIELFPIQLANFFESVENGQGLRPIEREPVFLEHGIIEVQKDSIHESAVLSAAVSAYVPGHRGRCSLGGSFLPMRPLDPAIFACEAYGATFRSLGSRALSGSATRPLPGLRR